MTALAIIWIIASVPLGVLVGKWLRRCDERRR